MKKLLILTTLMVLAFSMIANANWTRVQTLGHNSDVLLDPNNVFDYVSRVNDYPKWAIADFNDNDDFQTFGVLWQFGSQESPWVLGTFFHNSDHWYAYNDADWSSYWGGWDPIPFNLGSNQRIDLFYGRNLGTTPFGLHIGYIQAGQEYTITPDVNSNSEEKMRNLSINAGITLPASNIDLSAGLAMLSWTDKGNIAATYTDITKPSGGTSFWLRGRKFIAGWPNAEFTFVPHFKFNSSKIGIEYYGYNGDVNLDETDELKRFGLNVGAGLQWNPSADATCLIDFGFDYDKETWDYIDATDATNNEEYTSKIFSMPYFKMGAEGKVFDWLWARFGSTSYWANETDKYVPAASGSSTQEWKYSWPENETMLGLGFVFNRLHIDCNVDPELFLDGLYFISGEDNEMNFNFTVLYDLH